MPQEWKKQDQGLIYALDIGTRSIIGVAGSGRAAGGSGY